MNFYFYAICPLIILKIYFSKFDELKAKERSKQLFENYNFGYLCSCI
jgi:hypothetical protein